MWVTLGVEEFRLEHDTAAAAEIPVAIGIYETPQFTFPSSSRSEQDDEWNLTRVANLAQVYLLSRCRLLHIPFDYEIDDELSRVLVESGPVHEEGDFGSLRFGSDVSYTLITQPGVRLCLDLIPCRLPDSASPKRR